MRSRLPFLLLTSSGGAAISVAVALSASSTGDYATRGPVGGDNAGPAIDALAHGDLHRFVAGQPFMGLVSLLVRAPAAALASVFGGGNRLTYALGALTCLIPVCLLLSWIARGRGGRDRWFAVGVATLLLLLSPVALDAVQSGHPEEMLASVLATAAVLCARGGRARAAAILLGLAIGTKGWAAIAALPVLLALGERRISTALLATAVALPLTAAAPLADPTAFANAANAVGAAHTANAISAWWPFGSALHGVPGAAVTPTARWLPFGLDRSQALLFALVLTTCLLVPILRSARRGSLIDPLALLALLGLARCIGDPWNNDYYFLAALVPLVAWEVVTLRRAPIAAVCVTAAIAVTVDSSVRLGPGALDGLVLAWTLAVGCYLATAQRRACRAQALAAAVR